MKVYGDGTSETTARAATARPRVTIRPQSRWTFLDLRQLWEFRDLFRSLATRDVKLRYRQTALGAIWVVLQPLLAAGVLSFVFGRVARLPSEGVPYFVFAFAGLLGFNTFSSTVTKASSSLISNSAMVSKVYFPRQLLPISVVGSTVIDFGVALGMMVVLLVVAGINPGTAAFMVPVWLAIVLLFAMGVGLLTASLTVRYRDVQYVLPVAVQLALYASPVAYSLTTAPRDARSVLLANPLTGVLEGFRWSLLGTSHLHVGAAVYSAVAAVVAFLVGSIAFSRMERQFADVI